MDERERKREARKQKALERLGTNSPRCLHCGEDDWRCLEPHHVGGKRFDDLTRPECRNCHRKLSDLQKDHAEQIGSPPDPLECIAHFLLGIADLFELLIGKFREFAQVLIEQASKLHNAKETPHENASNI